MSRGFVKEDDQEEIPLVPLRAHLPDDATNLVTQNGIRELMAEKNDLEKERDAVNETSENDKEKRIATNYINSKLQLLQTRISSAKIIDFAKQSNDFVKFGATLTLKIGNQKKLQKYQIVGVDEANISKGKISFISPIAQLLLDKKLGDKAILKLTTGDRIFEIVRIEY